MVKKNTLLYLDENLVKAAKRAKLNLSEVMGEALKEKLLPLMSAGGRQLDFDQHLKDLKEDESCCELPFELESVALTNVGPLSEVDVKLKPGINVVFGPNGSGKSMMFRAITCAFGQPPVTKWGPVVLLKHMEKEGKIKISLRTRPAIELKLEADGEKHLGGCLLLDEPAYALVPAHKPKFVEWLRQRGGQVIIFTHYESFVVPSVHVVHLPQHARDVVARQDKV